MLSQASDHLIGIYLFFVGYFLPIKNIKVGNGNALETSIIHFPRSLVNLLRSNKVTLRDKEGDE